MVLKETCPFDAAREPLSLAEVPIPVPSEEEILVKVSVCGVCHTELDEIEGRTPPATLPIIPGHQIVGTVAQKGRGAGAFAIGERVGIGWIHSACGQCDFCRSGYENLCRTFRATGRDVDGGYAEYANVHEDFAFRIPALFTDAQAAPLLCAGAIGYRSLKLAGLRDGGTLGLTGFGASAHLVMKMVSHRYPGTRVFVFARSEGERAFARELGAYWDGNTGDMAPEELDSIIDTTPAWKPILGALANLRSGGRLVINAIGKEAQDQDSLLSLDYPAHLWREKEIKSVANVTRRDITEFLDLAAEIPIRPEIQEFALADANKALGELREKKIRGAKVLRVAE
jgi:propanol-preferring alcohol dehydrogenase